MRIPHLESGRHDDGPYLHVEVLLDHIVVNRQRSAHVHTLVALRTDTALEAAHRLLNGLFLVDGTRHLAHAVDSLADVYLVQRARPDHLDDLAGRLARRDLLVSYLGYGEFRLWSGHLQTHHEGVHCLRSSVSGGDSIDDKRHPRDCVTGGEDALHAGHHCVLVHGDLAAVRCALDAVWDTFQVRKGADGRDDHVRIHQEF